MSAGTRVGHCQADECDVYGGRHRENGKIRHMGNTPIGARGWLGNPYVLPDASSADDPETVVVESREEAVRRFAHDLLERADHDFEFRAALAERVRGRVLGGWCQHLDHDRPACHLEVVADVADAIRPVDAEEGWNR